MDLEVQLQGIVEEWSEQILSFELQESRNIQLLDVAFAEHLIGANHLISFHLSEHISIVIEKHFYI